MPCGRRRRKPGASEAAPAPELLAAAESLDPDALDLATISALLVFAGLDAAKGPSLPDESADVQALLEALPVGLRNQLFWQATSRRYSNPIANVAAASQLATNTRSR